MWKHKQQMTISVFKMNLTKPQNLILYLNVQAVRSK